MARRKPQYKLVRTWATFNTGTRIERPKKGKGSYRRKGRNNEQQNIDT